MSQTQNASDYRAAGTPPTTPRWVKGLGIVVLIIVLVVGVMLLSGHSPAQHMQHGADSASPTMEMSSGQQP